MDTHKKKPKEQPQVENPEYPRGEKHLLEEVDEARELREALAACEKERDEYLNGWRRAKADLANFKKEEARRAEIVIKFSTEELLNELLSVMDSFDRAIASEPEGQTNGLQQVRSQLATLLKRQGVEEIQSDGTNFNPALHEAIQEVESDTAPGTIIETIEKGWKLHGKVLRASRVKVAK